ncbi:hypothetical protein SAMN06265338_106163 [Rhodoblastus acidophilus]|uniref:Flagellar protein FlgN n=1 Tax=Rhodoblastus acidophilus TaxID=1074 RepID=A0A212RRE6_RHOAC|nr:flagellar protein FlgN [Rhodoblastus acidophilus]MCW2316227.1 hypothetical protein [Rhodoblastus acidophilus]PPQ38570.1 hypothetical protein CKO16_09775 [Rhodoblastus acidophilus]SNB75004.1 hypothetical protein SAMN06265338_106163 [Rhodoblastus acidophilus]
MTHSNVQSARALSQVNVHAAFADVISRVESIIEQETALLRENRAVHLVEFNTRKQQSLLELNRILRSFSHADLKSVDRAGVSRLMEKLEANRDALAHHLRAMDEISSLVSRAMQEAESDGTYGRGGV